MRIDAELAGDLEHKGTKYYCQSGTRMATFMLRTKIREDEAADVFGEELHRIVFGLMLIEDGIVRHSQGAIEKPSVVPERHLIHMLGHKFNCTPEIGKIVLVEDEAAAIVPIVLPMAADKGQEKILGDFSVRVGDVVKAKFDAKNLPLTGTEGPEVGKKDAGFGNVVPVAK